MPNYALWNLQIACSHASQAFCEFSKPVNANDHVIHIGSALVLRLHKLTRFDFSLWKSIGFDNIPHILVLFYFFYNPSYFSGWKSILKRLVHESFIEHTKVFKEIHHRRFVFVIHDRQNKPIWTQ